MFLFEAFESNEDRAVQIGMVSEVAALSRYLLYFKKPKHVFVSTEF